MGIRVVVAMVIVYLIVWEIRIMKTANCTIELEREKDKLKLLKQHEESKVFSVTRLSPERTAEIKIIEDDNTSPETKHPISFFYRFPCFSRI